MRGRHVGGSRARNGVREPKLVAAAFTPRLSSPRAGRPGSSTQSSPRWSGAAGRRPRPWPAGGATAGVSSPAAAPRLARLNSVPEASSSCMTTGSLRCGSINRGPWEQTTSACVSCLPPAKRRCCSTPPAHAAADHRRAGMSNGAAQACCAAQPRGQPLFINVLWREQGVRRPRTARTSGSPWPRDGCEQGCAPGRKQRPAVHGGLSPRSPTRQRLRLFGGSGGRVGGGVPHQTPTHLVRSAVHDHQLLPLG